MHIYNEDEQDNVCVYVLRVCMYVYDGKQYKNDDEQETKMPKSSRPDGAKGKAGLCFKDMTLYD